MTHRTHQIHRFTFYYGLLALLLASSIQAQTLQLDGTFGTGGKFTVGFGDTGLRSSYAFDVVLQSSGRIVVYGGHQSGGQIGIPGIASCGLTQSGALDAGFGTGGKILEMNSYPRSIVRLSNGQYLRLVYIFPTGVGLNRINLNGSVDSSFVSDLNLGSDVQPVLAAIRPDGKILVLLRRDVDQSNWLVRLNTNGSRDTSFGINGVLVLDLRRLPQSAIAGVHVLPDNRILLGGYQSTFLGPQGGNVAWAALLDENGYFDRRFGIQGIMRLPFPFTIRIAKTLFQPDGKAILVGHARPEMSDRLMMIRLTTRGRRDTSFGNSGIVMAPNISPGSSDIGHSAALMSDGRIVVVGSYGADQFAATSFLVARFGSSGVLEAHAITPFTADYHSAAYDVAIQPDGKAVVAGFTRNPDASADGNFFAIARYTQ